MNPHKIEVPLICERLYVVLENAFVDAKVFQGLNKIVVRGKQVDHPESPYLLQGHPLRLNPEPLHPGDAVTVAKELGAVLTRKMGPIQAYAIWDFDRLHWATKDGTLRPTLHTDPPLAGWSIDSIPQFNLRRC